MYNAVLLQCKKGNLQEVEARTSYKRSNLAVQRAGVRRAKAHLKPTLAMDIKDNKKNFYYDADSKRVNKENVGLLLNSAGI